MKIRKLFFLLLGCLMLAGCQKEIKSEDEHADVSDNTQITVSECTDNTQITVSECSDNTETTDVELEDDSDENLTTIKGSIQDQIMSGDFSCLTNEDWESEQKVYRNLEDSRQGIEWRQLDLNGDGIEDLILQEAETVSSDSEIKRIIGIFDCKRNEAKCVLWDVNDCTEYYFCGVTGELMYSAWSYGFVVSTEPYSHYYFDEEWNEIEDYTLVVYCIDSEMDEEYAEIWKQENPDMAEDGIYYRKYTDEGEEILTREELESIYEMETGYEFSSEFY